MQLITLMNKILFYSRSSNSLSHMAQKIHDGNDVFQNIKIRNDSLMFWKTIFSRSHLHTGKKNLQVGKHKGVSCNFPKFHNNQ